jgi:hypothetical protein
VFTPLLVALAVVAQPPTSEKKELPPPYRSRNWSARYEFHADNPAKMAITVRGGVAYQEVKGDWIHLKRVAHDPVRRLLVLEINDGPPPAGFAPQMWIKDPDGVLPAFISFQPAGRDAGLSAVLVRDTHRRVLLLLPITFHKEKQ